MGKAGKGITVRAKVGSFHGVSQALTVTQRGGLVHSPPSHVTAGQVRSGEIGPTHLDTHFPDS